MFFAIMILLVISSSLVYEAEHEAQPEAFASIPAAMWWGIVTLATVGYGDVYPKTEMGKLIGSIVVILGIGLFALPTGVLASGFAEVSCIVTLTVPASVAICLIKPKDTMSRE